MMPAPVTTNLFPNPRPSENAGKTQVSPAAAQREKARRILARRNFLKFCQYVDPHYEAPAHVQLVTEKLQQVAKFIESGGKEGISRLMIELPPRHGKSEMASRKFPAWLLGRNPDLRVILTSYGADLASKHSRAVRDLINSTRYQALFGGLSSADEPVVLSADSRSVAAWDLAAPHRGGMVAAGVGGGITGLGADLLILDDLFKNREEGESEARREFVDDWYKSSAYTRLEPSAAIIIFFTRWHQDDQAGRLIKRMVEEESADQWEIVFLPALALNDYPTSIEEQKERMREGVYLPLADPLGRKAGEALWPMRFGQEWMQAKRTNINPYEFEALYQQMPYLRQGGLFKREWFDIVDKGPGKEAVARAMYWDKAASRTGDFSAGCLISKDKDGFEFIELIVRGRWTPYEREKTIVDVCTEWYETLGRFPIWHQQDPAAAGKESAQLTNSRLGEAGLFGRSEPISERMNEVYAENFSTAGQAGKVKLVRGAWNGPFLEELVAYPNGAFDDQVVVASGCHAKLRERKKKVAKSYEG